MHFKYLLLSLCLATTLSQPPLYLHPSSQKDFIVSSLPHITPIEAFCDYETCEDCLACTDCVWCQNTPKPYCAKTSGFFSCPKGLLITKQSGCASINPPNCYLQSTCTDCLNAGCRWCDGDGHTYPAICVGLFESVNCAYGALHTPPDDSCNCGAATNCASCLGIFGCGWCRGDGSSTHPAMCVDPTNPFSCSFSAWVAPGGSC